MITAVEACLLGSFRGRFAQPVQNYQHQEKLCRFLKQFGKFGKAGFYHTGVSLSSGRRFLVDNRRLSDGVMSLLSLVLAALLCAANGTFLARPANQIVENGVQRDVLFECRVNPTSTHDTYWVAKSKVLYNSRTGYVRGVDQSKYEIAANARETGNFSLMVTNLQRADGGSYSCQHDTTAQAILTVADRPGKPSVQPDNGRVLIENDTVTFICESSGGFPSPNFTWTREGEQLPQTVYVAGDPAQSKLTLRLRYTDNGKDLKCAARNQLAVAETLYNLNVQHTPRLQIQPSNLIVLKDVSFQLVCNIQANPEPTSVRWVRNNALIPGSDGNTFSETNGVKADTLYRCRVENNRGTNEVTTEVIVHYAPVTTIRQGESISVNETERLELNCDVDAKPSANVRWLKDGVEISRTATYIIERASKSARGEYKCVSSNILTPSAGEPQQTSNEKIIAVNINYKPGKPTLIVRPDIAAGVYQAKDNVQLSCSLRPEESGNPPARFTWYHKTVEEVQISTGPNYNITNSDVTSSGDYHCRVDNVLGSEKSNTVQLSFQDIPKLQTTSPSSGSTLNYSISASDVHLSCVYKGFPEPQVSWYRNLTPLKDNTAQYTNVNEVTEEFPYKTVTSKLYFNGSNRRGVAVYDMDLFMCEASNAAGPSRDQYRLTVNVLFSPKIVGHGKVASDIREQVQIPCDVESYPPASSIVFRRNGRDVVTNDRVTLEPMEYRVDGKEYRQRRILTISSVQESHYGTYECTSENNIASTTRNIVLERSRVPDAPLNLTAAPLKWDSIHVQWLPGFDGGHPQNFVVMQNNIVVMKQTNDTKYTATNLLPDTEYEFGVYAQNKAGPSISSVVVFETTKQLAIPVAGVEKMEGSKMLTVNLHSNSSQFCVFILGGDSENEINKETKHKCLRVNNTVQVDVSDYDFEYYVAKACVANRTDVCGAVSSKPAHYLAEDDDSETIIIVVVVCVFVILIGVTAIAIVYALKRRRRLRKPLSSLQKNGHINPVMTNSSGHLSNDAMNFPGSNNLNVQPDVDLDDPVHYGDIADGAASQNSPPNQNLDYIYASVQKKSAEHIDKMNSNAYADSYEMQNHVNLGRNSVSDVDTELEDKFAAGPYGEQRDLMGPYAPNDLSMIIGNNSPPYNRFPSVSESGYSTPDSKALKKVIYEVIV